MKRKCVAISEVENVTTPSSSTSMDVGEAVGVTQHPSEQNDVGIWMGKASSMSATEKMEILKRPWVPPITYNFSGDVNDSKRKFLIGWLQTYAPWLVYSKEVKGALCLYCVIFPPNVVQGVLGALIVRPFNKYKNMHEVCKNHIQSQWHRAATMAAKNFIENTPVNLQMVTAHEKILEENRKIVRSIISTVLFCGTHDLPFRGKELHSGVFVDLIRFKAESGDIDLQNHVFHGKKNATYLSPQVQNQLIYICGDVVRAELIKDVQHAAAYSILADESCDISGKEQLSIGVRFFDNERNESREEFLGFVELDAMDANTIATSIANFFQNTGLDLEKCVGQGYDGCSTMSGKDNGVQKRLREIYPKAIFVHCASHRLNLVVNDLNQVSQIRNSVSTVRDTINFFKESTIRRKYIPNIPSLCETRWSQKYKSISVFNTNVDAIIETLDQISKERNYASRNKSYQLHSAVTKPEFVFCLKLIAKYSALIEPVVNTMQSKSVDLLKCKKHIQNIICTVRSHRENPEIVTDSLLVEACLTAERAGFEMMPPRTLKRQKHRANPPASSDNEYWNRALTIPYLDSLIMSLETRFGDDNSPAYALSLLHPMNLTQMTFEEFQRETKVFVDFYDIENFSGEAEMWYQCCNKMKSEGKNLEEFDLIDLLAEAQPFFPATANAIKIALAQPCTTCTIERSFSTLRRVKTWLRSTMAEERLSALCMLSVHRQIINKDPTKFVELALDRFCEDRRRMMLK